VSSRNCARPHGGSEAAVFLRTPSTKPIGLSELAQSGTAGFDSSGSYVNGTWPPVASMHDSRLDFASVVLAMNAFAERFAGTLRR
jgi:hypothetical protein